MIINPIKISKRAIKLFTRSIAHLIVVLFSCSLSAEELPIDIRFTHMISSKEDVVGEILVLHQDKFGFIWLGGKDGLARFDGYEYEIFRLDLNDPFSISNNVVNAIAEDDEGNLFLGTNKGLNHFIRETKHFIRYEHDPKNLATMDHPRIISLHKEKNILWIGTDNGLNSFDIQSKQFVRYPRNEDENGLVSRYVLGIESDGKDTLYISSGWGFKAWNRRTGQIDVYGAPGEPLPEGLPEGQVRTLLVESSGLIWVGTLSGLSLFDPSTKKFKFYPDSEFSLKGKSREIWDIHEDKEGEIWAGTDGIGLLRLDRSKDEFINYSINSQDDHAISSNVVHTIIEDKVGDIWLGAYPSGVDVIHRDSAVFQVYRNNTRDDKSISWEGVTAIIEDDRLGLWIGTDGGGLNYFDYETNTYKFFLANPSIENTVKSQAIMAILQDSGGQIWLGYWNEGVSRYDPKTDTFFHFETNRNDPNSLNAPDVFSIVEDRAGDIWIGTMGGGLSKYDPEKNNLVEFRYKDNQEDTLNEDRIWSIIEDKSLNLWLGTSQGLVKVNRENHSSVVYKYDEENDYSISNDFIVSLHEDSKGRLWVGTHGGGLNLFNPDSETFLRIGIKEGLANDIIYQVLEDDEGLLWLSTKKGISSYNPKTKEVRNFNIISGEDSAQFLLGSGVKLRNGDLVFGGISGYVKFDPKRVSINKFIPEIVLTDIKVANSSVEIAGPENILDKNIFLENTLHFNYKQNIFTLYYSALNFRNASNNKYSYMLEGFDENWFQVGNVRSATYTNLDPGVYRFRVKGSNDNDVWNEEGVSIQIIVSPAPWRTWWAYFIYIIAILSGVFWYVYTQRKMIGYQKSMVKSLSEVNKIKDQFIASTSHELRTPLFGIVGLAESLMQDAKPKLSGSEFKSLELIVSSAKRLVIQVNDILDFSSIKKNSLAVSIKAYNLFEITEMVVGILLPTITNEKVKLINKVKKNLPPVSADESRLQQILINLISNALKHTNEGHVCVEAIEKDKEIIIVVEDTGSGIAEDNFDALFQEFKQLDDVNTRKQGGTGLGLSITKRLVELQKGKIWVESDIGKGSKFFFSLPISNEKPKSISVSESAVTRVQSFVRSTDPELNETVQLSDSLSDDCHTILIVDDEAVNRIVLKGFMKKKKFKIYEAENGEKALEYFSKGLQIDLVILDVMMPGLSGFEVCEKIRTYKTLCELPVLFITARGQMDDLAKGFAVGGSDFLPKPVDRQELNARVTLHLKMLEQNRKIVSQSKAS